MAGRILIDGHSIDMAVSGAEPISQGCGLSSVGLSMSVDLLFRKHDANEVRSVLVSLEQELVTKTTDLRCQVGAHYRNVIGASDHVRSMHTKSGNLLASSERLDDSVLHIKECLLGASTGMPSVNECCVVDQSECFKHTVGGLYTPRNKNLLEDFRFTCSLSKLLELPQNVWKFLRRRRFDDACNLVLVRAPTMQNDLFQAVCRNAQFCAAVSVPDILEQQAMVFRHLTNQMASVCVEAFGIYSLGTRACLQCMAVVLLFDSNATPATALELFFNRRNSRIQAMLDAELSSHDRISVLQRAEQAIELGTQAFSNFLCAFESTLIQSRYCCGHSISDIQNGNNSFLSKAVSWLISDSSITNDIASASHLNGSRRFEEILSWQRSHGADDMEALCQRLCGEFIQRWYPGPIADNGVGAPHDAFTLWRADFKKKLSQFMKGKHFEWVSCSNIRNIVEAASANVWFSRGRTFISRPELFLDALTAPEPPEHGSVEARVCPRESWSRAWSDFVRFVDGVFPRLLVPDSLVWLHDWFNDAIGVYIEHQISESSLFSTSPAGIGARGDVHAIQSVGLLKQGLKLLASFDGHIGKLLDFAKEFVAALAGGRHVDGQNPHDIFRMLLDCLTKHLTHQSSKALGFLQARTGNVSSDQCLALAMQFAVVLESVKFPSITRSMGPGCSHGFPELRRAFEQLGVHKEFLAGIAKCQESMAASTAAAFSLWMQSACGGREFVSLRRESYRFLCIRANEIELATDWSNTSVKMDAKVPSQLSTFAMAIFLHGLRSFRKFFHLWKLPDEAKVALRSHVFGMLSQALHSSLSSEPVVLFFQNCLQLHCDLTFTAAVSYPHEPEHTDISQFRGVLDRGYNPCHEDAINRSLFQALIPDVSSFFRGNLRCVMHDILVHDASRPPAETTSGGASGSQSDSRTQLCSSSGFVTNIFFSTVPRFPTLPVAMSSGPFVLGHGLPSNVDFDIGLLPPTGHSRKGKQNFIGHVQGELASWTAQLKSQAHVSTAAPNLQQWRDAFTAWK